ncbi:MAG: DHH family phosphoesterase [Oscillospiraceae bacterium]|nr:DHH family phosphoesterase [Oscillospiraceae bacterium]
MDRNLKRLMRNEAYLFCVVLLIFAGVEAVYSSYWIALAMAAVGIILLLIMIFTTRQRGKSIAAYVQTSVDRLSQSVAVNAPYPMATVQLSNGEILWHNHQLQRAIGTGESKVGQRLSDVLPEAELEWVKAGQLEAPDDQVIRERRFRCLGYVPKSEAGEPEVALLQWIDSTELLDTRDEYFRSRPVVSIILIDNYDDLTNNLNDVSISNLNAALNSRISTWAENIGGLLRKLERNRFLFIFESKDLFRITEGKFSLLESVREITNPNGIAATLSFGVGKDGAGFQENYDFAALALEMALSRGGDQAVIKDKYDFSFYGGRAVETERRSKVKSRVMASSMSALIAQSSRVFLMGHKNADADAIGAACGVAALCRSLGKRVNIIVDLENTTAPKLISLIRRDEQYADVFLSAEDALIAADPNSLLVVVDTNRPEQVESKALLESIPRVAVVDHHRRAADYIANAALNLHEPFASSASELVTELLTYAVDAKTILPCELSALMAGIVLDTKNFTVRVNSRTFEAAAFLRMQGADPVEIKKLFKNDFEDTVQRYRIVEQARVYHGSIAISCQDSEINRALAGQAADELLNIDGIDSSFVLFRQKDRVFVSARSVGSINVQMVLEPLGGGGNAATAGVQLRDVTVEQAKGLVVNAIDRYFISE